MWRMRKGSISSLKIICLLQHTIPDYFPFCLEPDGINWLPCLFRFEDRWLKVPGSYDKIKEWMGDVEVKRKVSFKVGRKLVQLNPG